MTSAQLNFEMRRAKKQGITLKQRWALKKLKKDCLDFLRRAPRNWRQTAEAFEAWLSGEELRSIIEMCTGSGKTEVQAIIAFFSMLERMIKQGRKTPPFSATAMLSPKIVLNFQLQAAVFSVFKGMKDKGYDISEISTIMIHSGGENKTEEYLALKKQHLVDHKGKAVRDYDATTNREEIQEAIADCQQKNRPLIIFGTYHSAPTMNKVLNNMKLKLDLLLGDEAHRLVSEVFSKLTDPEQIDYEDDSVEESKKYTQEDLDAVCSIPTEKAVFATATPLHTDSNDSIGMNNPRRFGTCVFRYPAYRAIKEGVIAKPMAGWLRICGHIVKIDSPRIMKELVVESFKEFDKLNQQYNKGSPTKMVIRCRNSDELRHILEITSELKGEGITVAVVGSRVGNYLNGDSLGRAEWLSKVKKLGESRSTKMIVAHINIVTEGVDVPGLNSFLATCLMGHLMMIQNIGRVLRWSPGKSRAFVGVPQYTYNNDNASRWKELMNHYKNEYGDDWSYLTIDDWQEDGGDEEPRDKLQVSNGRKRKVKDELKQFVDSVQWDEFQDNELQQKDLMTKLRMTISRMELS